MSDTSAPTGEEERVKAELIADIEAAFDGVSRQGGVSLHEATVIDYYGSGWKRIQARIRDKESRWQDVKESRWQDVPEDDLNNEMGEYTFLDPIGFRYYIPAFMIFCLNYFRTGIPINDDVLFYGFASSSPHSENQWSLLDCKQREVISRYLYFFVRFDPDGEYMDTPAAQEALRNSWAKYLPSK